MSNDLNTSSYFQELYMIQTANPPTIAQFSLADHNKVYKIDLQTRRIEEPKDVILVKHDHKSSTIYFQVPRYFDNVDLSTTVCLIQYVNADKESFYYPVPYYDIDSLSHVEMSANGEYVNSEVPMMILPWCVSDVAAGASGEVNFSFRFFKFKGEGEISYNLNTLPQKLRIYDGLSMRPQEYTREDALQAVAQSYDTYFKIAAESKLGDLFWEVV